MDFDIKLFDDYRENNRLEAKKARGGLPNSLWDTYSAMANCYGGVILLGVIEREDGSFATTGLKDIEKLKKDFWNVINDRKKVSINLLTGEDVEAYVKIIETGITKAQPHVITIEKLKTKIEQSLQKYKI